MSVVLLSSIIVLEKLITILESPKIVFNFNIDLFSHYFVTLLNYSCKNSITTNKNKELATLVMVKNV